jgi:hypothetical protein
VTAFRHSPPLVHLGEHQRLFGTGVIAECREEAGDTVVKFGALIVGQC